MNVMVNVCLYCAMLKCSYGLGSFKNNFFSHMPGLSPLVRFLPSLCSLITDNQETNSRYVLHFFHLSASFRFKRVLRLGQVGLASFHLLVPDSLQVSVFL